MPLNVTRGKAQKLIDKFRQLPKKTVAIITGVVVCAVAGGGVWAFTYGPMASLQAESGTLSGGTTMVADGGASGGSVIKFGSNTPAGTCPVANRLTINAGNQSSYPAYSIGTQVYVPDGPDPWRDGTDTIGGCFPGPNNTGVPTGTTLTDYVSTIPHRSEDPGHLNDNFYWPEEDTCYIKAPNTVIDSKTVNCSLRIRSKNVQIKNSYVEGVIYIDDAWCEGTGSGTSSFVLTDSTVFNPNPYGGRTLGLCDYTVIRSKLSGGPSVGVCSNCTIKDSYMYLDDSSADPVDGIRHNSVMRVGANANLEHNTWQCLVKTYENTGTTSDPTEESGCSANQTAYSHDGLVPSNSTIKRNFYMTTSGGYCGWGGSTSGADNQADGVHDVRFIENIFQRKNMPIVNGTTGAVSYTGTNCGLYGPMSNFYDRPGNVWQCNRWDNGDELQSDMVNPTYATLIRC
jgi:hypothetical protein